MSPATGDTGDADDLLLGELRRAVTRMDPVPAPIAALAAGLLSWRDPGAQLAELVADSRELAGAVRSGNLEVLLRFEGVDVAVSVDAAPDGSGRYRMLGQIEPGLAGTVEVRQEGAAPVVARCDEWGRFEAHPVPTGAVSLRWTPDGDDGRVVHTAWVVI